MRSARIEPPVLGGPRRPTARPLKACARNQATPGEPLHGGNTGSMAPGRPRRELYTQHHIRLGARLSILCPDGLDRCGGKPKANLPYSLRLD